MVHIRAKDAVVALWFWHVRDPIFCCVPKEDSDILLATSSAIAFMLKFSNLFKRLNVTLLVIRTDGISLWNLINQINSISNKGLYSV